VPVPVSMLTRRVVVVGATVAEQGAAEEKQDQFAFPGMARLEPAPVIVDRNFRAHQSRIAAALRVRKAFVHITSCPPYLTAPSCNYAQKMKPREQEWFRILFRATRAAGARLNKKAMDTFWSARYIFLMWAPWLRAGWRDTSKLCSRPTRTPQVKSEPPIKNSKL